MLSDLEGKRVIVTGASTGIGAAVARGFARHGAVVVVHYRSSVDEARSVAAAIGDEGGKAILVAGDLAVPSEAERVIAEAADQLGGIDILVNNAGAMVARKTLMEIDDAYFDAVNDLNIRSLIKTTRASVPHLRAAGGGAVINTTSIAARTGGSPGAGIYGAAKAYVSSLTRNFARELAALNVRVNAVSPGVIATPFHDRYSSPEFMEAARKAVPLDRIGTPDECVGAYLFLASAAMSGYVTGQVIEVNGGQFMP